MIGSIAGDWGQFMWLLPGLQKEAGKMEDEKEEEEQ